MTDADKTIARRVYEIDSENRSLQAQVVDELKLAQQTLASERDKCEQQLKKRVGAVRDRMAWIVDDGVIVVAEHNEHEGKGYASVRILTEERT